MLRLLLVALLSPATARAADPNVIIFGGGWGPEGTQASIEAHVAALAKVLGPSKPTVLFAGEAAARSVQVSSPEPDPVDELLGILFDRRDHLQVGYRKKEVQSGKSSRDGLLAAITAAAGQDGLVVLGAGHGAPAERDREAALELWGPNDKLHVSDLARHLDQQARGPVAFVLGQCHSGAFAELIYSAGKPPQLAGRARCVLAAVPHDREASGCTPDVNDASADAYMAMIAEAFEKRADYDGDGATSLADAHAYARIHDRTVDVPIASSESFLIQRLGNRLPRAATVRLGSLLASARPTERGVLEKLDGGQLLAAGPKAVVEELEELDHRLEGESEKLDRILDERDLLRRNLVDAVLAKWPELANPYHRVSRKMLAGDAAEVVGFVKQKREWTELVARDDEIRVRDRQILSLEKRAALLERFVRAVQVVAGERILSRRDRAAFSALVACEAMKPRVRQP